jgi:hypothetical protein
MGMGSLVEHAVAREGIAAGRRPVRFTRLFAVRQTSKIPPRIQRETDEPLLAGDRRFHRVAVSHPREHRDGARQWEVDGMHASVLSAEELFIVQCHRLGMYQKPLQFTGREGGAQSVSFCRAVQRVKEDFMHGGPKSPNAFRKEMVEFMRSCDGLLRLASSEPLTDDEAEIIRYYIQWLNDKMPALDVRLRQFPAFSDDLPIPAVVP